LSISTNRRRKKLTLENNLRITKQIVDAVSIPIMADGENGYADGTTLQDNIRIIILFQKWKNK